MRLPLEIWEWVWRFLLPPDRCVLRLVCREWSRTPHPTRLHILLYMRIVVDIEYLAAVAQIDRSGRFLAFDGQFGPWALSRYVVMRPLKWKRPVDYLQDQVHSRFDPSHLEPRGRPPPSKHWCVTCAGYFRNSSHWHL